MWMTLACSSANGVGSAGLAAGRRARAAAGTAAALAGAAGTAAAGAGAAAPAPAASARAGAAPASAFLDASSLMPRLPPRQRRPSYSNVPRLRVSA